VLRWLRYRGRGKNITSGGLSPGHDERGSASLYSGLEAEPPAGVQEQSPWCGGQGRSPPEAESSVAYEAPAEEPNLTLVTDSFCSSYRKTLMFISHKFGGAKSVVSGGLNSLFGGTCPPQALLSSPQCIICILHHANSLHNRLFNKCVIHNDIIPYWRVLNVNLSISHIIIQLVVVIMHRSGHVYYVFVCLSRLLLMILRFS